ncbi:hypothetical protein LMG26685_02896 [Achromobacter mucicolens]|uniref:hypothetical protein n=1 Tax=Achromobacter mucicolens TaxID=1389922 RepID=UPI0009D16505|nr:hypothetical protein [Achromobacter mucicolens]OXC91019.1 hypothetical protein BMR85_007420 [Achromobacter sp. KAs 3-5]CAB3653888.1 hypothetical protein LMG26685_02896 [Achromobacter mucicolens]
MALPRSIEDSNKQMRTAAIERLRAEHGVVLDKKRRGAEGIADAIRAVEPSLQSDDAMVLIRAWVALKPSEVVPGRLAYGSGQPYTLDSTMRNAASRLQAMRMPTPVSMSSRVQYSPEFA